MLTGVKKGEKWVFWFLLVFMLLWVGPGLELFNKPIMVGAFPLLHVFSFGGWIILIILNYIIGYKLETFSVSDIEEEIKTQELRKTQEFIECQKLNKGEEV